MRVAAPARRNVQRELRAPIPWKRSIMASGWWSAPHVLSLLLWLALMFTVAALDQRTFRTYWKTPKFIDDDFTRLFLWSTLAFSLASFTMTQVMRSSSHRRLRGTWLLERGFRKVVYALFMVGMVSTIGFAILRTGGPVSFLQQVFTVLTGGGGSAPMRNAFAPVSGLTSLTQLGVLIVLIEAINVKWVDHAPDRRTSRRRLWVVVTYGIIRSVLASERLAAVELLLPLMVVWARAHPLRSPRQAVLMAIAPFLAVVILFFGFAGTEYFRSYQSYKERIDDSLTEFSRNRLLGYYATSLNNSALYMQYDTPKAPFAQMLDGVLDWPGVRSTLQISDPKQVNAQSLLQAYANPEFTNRAPPGILHLEGGSLWVVAFMAGFGAISGIAYAGYRYGSVGGAVWFGLVFTAVVELPRIWYLTSPRMSAVIVVAFIGWLRYQRVRA